MSDRTRGPGCSQSSATTSHCGPRTAMPPRRICTTSSAAARVATERMPVILRTQLMARKCSLTAKMHAVTTAAITMAPTTCDPRFMAVVLRRTPTSSNDSRHRRGSLQTLECPCHALWRVLLTRSFRPSCGVAAGRSLCGAHGHPDVTRSSIERDVRSPSLEVPRLLTWRSMALHEDGQARAVK